MREIRISLHALSRECCKRVDRAFPLGHELPPVSLYKLGNFYFVKVGHHRVSVARFHGAEWIDAETTEFGIRHQRSAGGPTMTPIMDS
jgi:hypothetical protein